MGWLGCLQKVVLFSMFLFGLLTRFRKMTWRCSLTSNLRPSALIFVGFHNIFLFWLQALLWEGPGIFVGKNASKCQKKVQLVPLSCSRVEWRCFEVDEFFKGLLPVPFLCEKCPFFEIPMFAWKSWSILLPRLRAFCARIWNWFKTVFPTSTVFKKMPWAVLLLKNAVFFTAKWLRIWCIQMMHSNFEFTDAPDPEVSGCTWDPVDFWSKFFQRLAVLPWSLSDN